MYEKKNFVTILKKGAGHINSYRNTWLTVLQTVIYSAYVKYALMIYSRWTPCAPVWTFVWRRRRLLFQSSWCPNSSATTRPSRCIPRTGTRPAPESTNLFRWKKEMTPCQWGLRAKYKIFFWFYIQRKYSLRVALVDKIKKKKILGLWSLKCRQMVFRLFGVVVCKWFIWKYFTCITDWFMINYYESECKYNRR